MFKYLYEHQVKKFAAFIFFSMLSCLFEIGLAYIMLKCVDLSMERNLSEAGKYAIGFLIYIMLYFGIDYFTKKMKWDVLCGAQTNLRNNMVEQIFSMSLNDFHKKSTSGWLSELTNQLDMIEESYFKIWFGVFVEIFEFVVSIIFLFYISPLLTLFVLVVTSLQMIVPKVMSPIISKKRRQQALEAEGFTVTAMEHFGGFDLLKSFHLTSKSVQAVCSANRSWENSKFHIRLINSTARLLSSTFGQILYIGIYFFGAILTVLGHMTFGTMIAASQLVVYIAAPLETLSADITEIKSAKDLIQNLLLELVHSTEQEEKSKSVPAVYHKLEAKHISFSYEGNSLFEDVNFSVQRGGKYLLCGPSGVGKSTLIQILTGSIRPNDGNVVVDGTNINNISSEQLSRFILQCSQNTFVFNATLRDNVTLFSDVFSDEEVLHALMVVELGYVLERYEDGLNHTLKQGGMDLSGGERQKIALARMELFHPPIVVLDESFANIDSETAKRLVAHVVLDKQRTVIMIAHQLSDDIVQFFDTELVIKDKSIIVKGKKNE